jgi:transposase-like protein
MQVIVILLKSSAQTVWLYHRFTLSFRDIEELLAARGIVVSYETIRQWCKKYGSIYCNQIKKSHSGLIELETLILDNTIHYRGEHEYKTSVQNDLIN